MFDFLKRKKKKSEQDDVFREEENQFNEEENQFQPYDEETDTITTEEEESERRGRRLKGKVIAGGIAVAGLIMAVIMFNNLFTPTNLDKEVENTETFSKGDVALRNTPKSYSELAKYDAERKRKLEELRRQQEAERAKQQKQQPQQKVVQPQPPVRQVEPPKVTSIPTPSIPVMPPAVDQKTAEAIKSPIGFSVGGQSEGGLFGTYTSLVNSRVDMNNAHVIQAGTVVPAVLIMGIDTRSPGLVTAQIRQDVYDSQTGQHLLIPQGSKLIGKVAGGGRRVAVTFNRIILPDGTGISLPEQHAVDNQGFGGMKDKYDRHDSDFYRGVIISGIVGYLADAVDEHFERKNEKSSNSNEAAETAMTKVADNITERVMERFGNTEQPNAIIRQGFQFNVLITEDFTAYEYVR